jgi:methionyl aminopeptidase
MPASLSLPSDQAPPIAAIPSLDEEDSGSDDEQTRNNEQQASSSAPAAGEGSAAAKKKKNKKKKKPASAAAAAAAGAPASPAASPAASAAPQQRLDGSVPLDLSGKSKTPHGRGLTAGVQCDSYTKTTKQTWPPTVPVEVLFQGLDVPLGQIMEHPGDGQRYRITSAETRAQEMLMESSLRQIRLASECHRQVRKWAQSFIKPGIRLIDMCEEIEERNRLLVKENGLHAGVVGLRRGGRGVRRTN